MKEDTTAEKDSYVKLYNMIGGFSIVCLLCLATIFFQYFELYKASVSQEWADATPEMQVTEYYTYLTKLAWISIIGLFLRIVHQHIIDDQKRVISRSVHKDTLTRILLAPVNTFFDVTPIGKIMQIF